MGTSAVVASAAVAYIMKVKERFAGQPHIFDGFLHVLRDYKKDSNHGADGQALPAAVVTHMKKLKVSAQVAALFTGHADLLGEFLLLANSPAMSLCPPPGADGRGFARAPEDAGQQIPAQCTRAVCSI
jgi:histone deacetylase complex regulatory component SIN3